MGYSRADFAREPDVTPEVLEHFDQWLALLQKWNRRINLVAPATVGGFWRRHALDSWQLAAHVPSGAASAIDLGSGAGFPGLAIALALKLRGGEGRVLLVESAGKKANFLRTVARELGLPASVTTERAEALDARHVDLVSARAFAPLPRLFDYAAPFFGPDTVGLFPKGLAVDDEVLAAEAAGWRFGVERVPSRADVGGCVLKVTSLIRAA